jgi:thymidine kinase
MAKLRFYHSVMNSGKSLRLLATAHDFDEKNIEILVIKPSIDTRDGKDVIKSRAGLKRKCISVSPSVDLFKAINDTNKVKSAMLGKTIKWVLVDECQFLTEAQVEQLSDVVDFLNIEVACYGLRTDFKSKLFSGSKRLFELADEIKEIKTLCPCGEKASINARFNKDGAIITEGSQILVGGDDLYKPICRREWKELIRQQIAQQTNDEDT